MSELRAKMKMDLELRGYSPQTVKYYIAHVSRFAKHYNKSPDLLGENEIRDYLHHCPYIPSRIGLFSFTLVNSHCKIFA